MAFRWRADDGPLLVLFRSSLPLQKTLSELDPLWQNFLDSHRHTLFFLVLSVIDAFFKAKEVRRLLKLISTGKGPFAKPDRRILEWELKKMDGIKDGTELDGGIGEHNLHIKPEEQNRILWVCQYII